MYPHERSLVKNYKNRPFAIVGVNSDRDRKKIADICKEKNLSWRSFWQEGGTGGPISTRWNVQGWPTTYLLDHKGVIRFKGVGRAPPDELIEKWVKVAEEEAAAATTAR